MKKAHVVLIGVWMVLHGSGSPLQAQPAKVELRQTEGKYRLYVNGTEFYVKGAGCEFGNIEKLAEHGANSFRTWRTENGQSSGKEILDRAQKSGLMVLMGLELIPERRGFNYSDPGAVEKQFNEIKEQVLRYKDHPALLGWLVGNELNLLAKDPRVWDAVNQVAKYINEVDPYHPAATAFAGISRDVVDEVKKRAPDLDFITVQFYGDIVNLHTRLQDAGWEGPYMVTEWGATGHWEVPLTEWKAPIEETSSVKAKAYADRYEVISRDPLRCLGSYVFLWGQKQERTPTWYGMFTASGDEMETVEVMHKIWKGSFPPNRCPQVQSVTLNGHGKTSRQHIRIKLGTQITGAIAAVDPDNDPLEYVFEIMPESTDLKTGGDFETTPEVLASVKTNQATIALKTPDKPGPYRLFFYVRDGQGHCGTANIPFFVEQ